jgi:hypothetical protein
MSTEAVTTKLREVNALAKEDLFKKLPSLPKEELIDMLKGYIDSYDERNLFILESGLHKEFKEHTQRFAG